MFDVWFWVPEDGRTGHPSWVLGYIYCPHTKNAVYYTADHYDRLIAMCAFDPDHVDHHVSAIWREACDWWRTYNGATEEARRQMAPVSDTR